MHCSGAVVSGCCSIFSATNLRAKAFRFFAHVGWRSVCSISLPTKSAGSTCRKCDCCKSQPVQSEVSSSNFGKILHLAWSSNARQILKHQKPNASHLETHQVKWIFSASTTYWSHRAMAGQEALEGLQNTPLCNFLTSNEIYKSAEFNITM